MNPSSSNPISATPAITTVTESLEAIHEFLSSFSPDSFNKKCWSLITCAFASEEADHWSRLDRADLLFLYEQLTQVSEALWVLDRQLAPLFNIT